MSDGTISQDEIDALLAGVNLGGGSPEPSPVLDTGIDISFFKSFASASSPNLSSGLETMTGAAFIVNSPVVEMTNREGLLAKLPEMLVAVLIDFNSGISGDHLFLFSPDFAKKLTALVNKEDSPELDDMALSVISEAVSQYVGSEITQLEKTANLSGLGINPAEALHVPQAMVRFPQNNFLLISYPVSVDGGAYTVWELFSSDVANSIIQSATGSQAGSSTGGLSADELAGLGGMGGVDMGNMGNSGADMSMGGGINIPGMNIPNVQPLQYPNLQQGMASIEQGNIGLIMDVYMEMTVELGRTKKQIKEILGMGEGTIIELDKLAGEPVDILVNHKPIAKGEVVVIDENFGVRVTEILSPIERVTDLH